MDLSNIISFKIMIIPRVSPFKYIPTKLTKKSSIGDKNCRFYLKGYDLQSKIYIFYFHIRIIH
jgi:hypothetical protein